MESVPEFLLISVDNEITDDSLRIQAQSDAYHFSQSEEGLMWALSFIQFFQQTKEQNAIGIKIPAIALSIFNNWITNNYDDIPEEVKGNIKSVLFNHEDACFINETLCNLLSKTQTLFVIASITSDWNSFFTEFLVVECSEGKKNEIILFLSEFLDEVQKLDNFEIVSFLEESRQDEAIMTYVLNCLDFHNQRSIAILNKCLSFMQESFLSDEAVLTKIGQCMEERISPIDVFDCINTILYRNVSEETKTRIATTIVTPEIIQEVLSSIGQSDENEEEEKQSFVESLTPSYDEESFLYTISLTVASLAKISVTDYAEIVLDIYTNGTLSSIDVMSELILKIVSLLIENGESTEELSQYMESTFLALCKYYSDDEYFDDEFVKTEHNIMMLIFNNNDDLGSTNLEMIFQFFVSIMQQLDNDENLIIFITSITDFVLSFVSNFSQKTEIAAVFFPIIAEFFQIFEERPPFENQLLGHAISNIANLLVFWNEVADFDVSTIFQNLVEIANSGFTCISSCILGIIRTFNEKLTYHESFLEETVHSSDITLIRCCSEALSLSTKSFQEGSFESCFGVLFEQAKIENILEFDEEIVHNLLSFFAFLQGVSRELFESIKEPTTEYFHQICSLVSQQEAEDPNVETILYKDSIRSAFVNAMHHCLGTESFEMIWSLLVNSLDDPRTIEECCRIFATIGLSIETICGIFPQLLQIVADTYTRNTGLCIEVDESFLSYKMTISFFDFCSTDIFNAIGEELQAHVIDFCIDIIKTGYQNIGVYSRVVQFITTILEIREIQPEALSIIALKSWNHFNVMEYDPREEIELTHNVIKLHALLLLSGNHVTEIAAPEISNGLSELGVEKEIEEYAGLLNNYAQDNSEENMDNIIAFYTSIIDEIKQGIATSE